MKKTTHSIVCCLACLMPTQMVFSDEVFDEYECLHLNIGLAALLETENTYFQRKETQQYDEGAIGKGLALLRKRGELCSITQKLYLEAAEYSLHFRKLDDAEYFLHKARKTLPRKE